MKPKKEELFPLVMEEAILLRNSITDEERAKLDYGTLDPQSHRGCIYGQITGYCNSPRAIKLIEKCCTKVYEAGKNEDDMIGSAKLNGSPKKKKRVEGLWKMRYYSPIEIFIDKYRGNNKKLVDFLKKKTSTLGF